MEENDKNIQEIKEKVNELIGSVVYRINEYAREPIIPMDVIGIYINQRHHSKQTFRIDCIGKHDMDESSYLDEHIGEKVFLSYNEALEKYLKKVEKRINSITEVDLSKLKCPMAAVYEKPLDFSNNYVIRIFDADIPTNVVMVKDTLEELMEDIAVNTDMVFIQRGADDVESLVGVWM